MRRKLFELDFSLTLKFCCHSKKPVSVIKFLACQ